MDHGIDVFPVGIGQTGGQLRLGGRYWHCALGRAGVAFNKREGDGATPVGMFVLRRLFYRGDRMRRPTTKLPVQIIAPKDGWCDAPEDPAYNRRVDIPYAASHEKLWRDDRLYDLIVEIGYNDSPVRTGRGSAIFMHVARDDYRPTEGCVALKMRDLRVLLMQVSAPYLIRIHPMSLPSKAPIPPHKQRI